jgi:hypothetical protein
MIRLRVVQETQTVEDMIYKEEVSRATSGMMKEIEKMGGGAT